jgi:carboxylesterase
MASPNIHNPHLNGNPFFWPGQQDGILLIHGFTATVAEVRPLAEALHRAGYSIAAPLLPGHYTRPEDLNRVRWQDWVAAVQETYRQLADQCERVIVGGESTGGLLSLYLAAQIPQITALLLYAPALRLNTHPFDRLRLYLTAPFLPWIPKNNMDSDDLWQGYPVNPLKGVIQLLELQKQVRPLLGKIHQPTMIVQGSLDQTVHPDVPATIHRHIQSEVCEIHWMNRSGHCVILDQERQEVFEITLQFIDHVLHTQKSSGHRAQNSA